MKTYSSAYNAYRGARREFYQINLLSFKVRNRSTGAAQWFHFSNRDDNETIEVVNQTSGALEFRDYIGGGAILSLDNLVRSEGTGVRNFNLQLSGTSPEVLDMIQGYDCRDAVFEWHIGEGEDNTGIMVDAPVCEFVGFVDTADRDDAETQIDSDEPAASSFTVSVVGHISALQRTNPDMRSHEIGKERSGDNILQYAGAANQWNVLWGKRGHRHGGGNGGGGDGKDKPDFDPLPLGRR